MRDPLVLVFLWLFLEPSHAFAPLKISERRVTFSKGKCPNQKVETPFFLSSSWSSISLLASSVFAEIDHGDGDSDDGNEFEYLDEFDPGVHEIYWLDPQAELDETKTLGECIGQGQAVVCVPNVATPQECRMLLEAALEAMEKRGTMATARGRSRFSVSDPRSFDNEIVLKCDEILLRVLDHVDDNIPSVYETLFEPHEDWLAQQPLNAALEQPTVPPLLQLRDTCDSLRELYMMGELEWSEGEPAINVYEPKGYFGAHKDHLALTVLIPLTAPRQDFEGGGTGFWAGNRAVDENPFTPPDWIISPAPGSALLFGGDVTHSGMPVVAGLRSVLVCSFSTRTPASSPDRLHGLQAPPMVSPNFKGSM